MTKDTADFHNFMQWHVVSTLFQEKKHHNQKVGSKGTQKIGPVLEVATCCLHGKYGVEIRIMSLNRDKTHSWVRISHGSNRFVMNLNMSGNPDTNHPLLHLLFLPVVICLSHRTHPSAVVTVSPTHAMAQVRALEKHICMHPSTQTFLTW